ncbi:hypothetical protein DEDE109153_04145 [Deinococcus deserti]|uniref:Uncharacterized protein n=1 Tax=Deinococcus deserti (strain DSM 17065 / CIP 109153 / LMG 22923 / VCD115) TaxID=546414 RepID=C1D0R3_DEIDV|nr:hypothetical protein [Deinococcus deserti]ACO45437.1 hypothetical protein Deide_05961 [Deinococcus deserti VCD115]
MGRLQRFLRYEFAPWPDQELLAAAAFHRPVIVRVQQHFHSSVALEVDLRDADAGELTQTLRLSWQAFETEIYALESYNEFYSGPYAQTYSWKPDNPRRFLHEIVNESDPWIEELLADNSHNGVFPMSGTPVMARQETLARNSSWPPPTGRFFRRDAPLGSDGRHVVGTARQAQHEVKRFNGHLEQMWLNMVNRPRYRHLFIASDTHMLEVLCGDLPTWTWISA